MIERVLIKDFLSFKNVDIELGRGLTAFSGASGAGKSLLMEALLTLFGLKDAEVKLIEASVDLPLSGLDEFGIESEDVNILRFTKEKKARYFINSQGLSKKNMTNICKGFIRYLSSRDDDEFNSDNLIALLDEMIALEDKNHFKNLNTYAKEFDSYIELGDELEKIKEEEKKIDELKEFAKYEIKTIEDIDPKIGEDEELMKVKKSLSKRDKISQAINEANGIFEFENAVCNMLDLCEVDGGFFDECMNELRALMEDEESSLEELEDVDIEQMLERIEQISKLKSRFGEIEDILKYKEKKLIELERYENISFQKENLQKDFEKSEKIVKDLCKKISKKRVAKLSMLEGMINEYLKKLYLNSCQLVHGVCKLEKSGSDVLSMRLDGVDMSKISSGELNRIRLAFIAAKNQIQSDGKKGILILDEVDANLSGKESMSVAKVLKDISSSYQVLVISHQPQLSSVADEHFLVEKKDGESNIFKLDKKQRINELARMVSGENIDTEALSFATKLLSNA